MKIIINNGDYRAEVEEAGQDLTYYDVLQLITRALKAIGYNFIGEFDLVDEITYKPMVRIQGMFCSNCKTERNFVKLQIEDRWFKNRINTYWVCIHCGERKLVVETTNGEEEISANEENDNSRSLPDNTEND